MGAGGRPVEYQTAVCDRNSSERFRSPYQRASVSGVQMAAGSAACAVREESRSPTRRGRPCWWGKSLWWRSEESCIQAQPGHQRYLSANGVKEFQGGIGDDRPRRRGGAQAAQRCACRIIFWRAQLVSGLKRRRRRVAERSEGASTVRKGSAHTRPAQGIGAKSIILIQRSPRTLTKWL